MSTYRVQRVDTYEIDWGVIGEIFADDANSYDHAEFLSSVRGSWGDDQARGQAAYIADAIVDGYENAEEVSAFLTDVAESIKVHLRSKSND